MSQDDPPTQPKRPSAIRISHWGMVQVWLAREQNRHISLSVDHESGALRVTVFAGDDTEACLVEEDEDVSKAAVRLVSKMGA